MTLTMTSDISPQIVAEHRAVAISEIMGKKRTK